MSPIDDNEALQIGPDPDKLFVYHRQQLSAMLDGELSPDQAKFMLRRLQHDGELAACWERWQVCGDVLRGQRNDLLPADFAGRVALAIAGDAGASAEAAPAGRAPRPRLARWGGGAAIAASVALLAMFASRQLPEPGALPEEAAPAPLVAAAPAVVGSPALPAQEQPRVADAMADATAPAPAAPLQDGSAALAATAVAVAELPRRAAERRNRAQPQRDAGRAQLVRETSAPLAIAANAEPPVIQLPDEALATESTGTGSTGDRFAMPQAASARPWPRSLLSSGNAFTVADGGLAPREPEFDPFLPGDHGLPWQLPIEAEPARNDAAAQP